MAVKIMSPEDMRRKRETLRMTQEQFAEKLSVHRVSVARWETGTLDIDERTRLAVEHLLYCDRMTAGDLTKVRERIKRAIRHRFADASSN